ncbi:MAG: hypothetical protein U5N86_08435 [Planctomycetota bacterium]|nr:hypothetical protein [Planctomycetota bacterium]
MFRTASLTFILLLIATLACADVVVFNDGQRKAIRGEVEKQGDKVIVKDKDGKEQTFAKGEVTVYTEEELGQKYDERLADIAGQEYEKLFELAMWCDRVGYELRRDELLLRILRDDPMNELVHEYFGHVLKDGRWVSRNIADEFGKDIENDLNPGEMVEVKGKYFTVQTDTSRKFGQLCAEYMDGYAEKVMNHFERELRFRMKKAASTVVIYQRQDEYDKHFREAANQVLPRERRIGILDPKVSREYQPPADLWFVDPVEFCYVGCRYEQKGNVYPMRVNLQLTVGYALYREGLGGMKTIFKCARGIMEGFAQYIAWSHIENEKLVPGDYGGRPRDVIIDARRELDAKYLLKLDPIEYYVEDKYQHRAASWLFANHMLSSDKWRKYYIALVRKDSSGGLRMSGFEKIIRGEDKLFAEIKGGGGK